MNACKHIMVATAIAMSGCAHHYDCRLGEKCYNSVDVLDAAKNGGGNSEAVIHEPEQYPKIVEKADDKNDKKTSRGLVRKFGNSHYKNRPVYIPDAPLRIWVAPHKTSDRIVSDYFIYTRIPGGYMDGVVNPGGRSASSHTGFYGPLDRKKELGFNPVYNSTATYNSQPKTIRPHK